MPDGQAALALDVRIAAEIRDSVARIERALERVADAPTASPRESVRARGPLPALAVATYFDLLAAVLADDVPSATEALGRFHAASIRAAPPFVRSWSGLAAEEAGLYSRHLNTDPSTRLELGAPGRGSSAAATRAIGEGLDLLDRAAPEIAGEIRALVRQIVLVSGTVNGTRGFDGATTFTLWGALFLNAAGHASRIEAVDGLVHESAHAVLFGHSSGRPFVDNDPGELHPSPLRADARPLDGIFHATFVSARIGYAFDRLLRAGVMTGEEAAIAREKRDSGRRAFAAGSLTLRRHARLTRLGDDLLAAATEHMAGHAAVD